MPTPNLRKPLLVACVSALCMLFVLIALDYFNVLPNPFESSSQITVTPTPDWFVNQYVDEDVKRQIDSIQWLESDEGMVAVIELSQDKFLRLMISATGQTFAGRPHAEVVDAFGRSGHTILFADKNNHALTFAIPNGSENEAAKYIRPFLEEGVSLGHD